MRHKWIIPLLMLPFLVGSSSSQGQTSTTEAQIKPILTVGSDQTVSIDPRVEQTLQFNGVQFSPIIPPVGLPISANRALELANNIVLPELTQQPIKTTVEFVSFSSPRHKYQDKIAWKVTYWGASVQLNGPGPGANASPSSITQPTSKQAVTWVLIDPTDIKKDFLLKFSGGPIHD